MPSAAKEVVQKWYKMAPAMALGGAVDVYIYGEIGWEVTADMFVRDLSEVAPPDAPLNVYINSPGGSIYDGTAIYNVLKRRSGGVAVFIDGIALSMGSAIAMAGDTITMPENALMMIHEPSWSAYGTSDQLRQRADVLDQMRDALVSIYAEKTGKTQDEIKAIMAAETWMTGAQAVEAGFADVATEADVDLVACAAGFDLSGCRNVPQNLREMVAQDTAAAAAKRKDVSMPAANKGNQAPPKSNAADETNNSAPENGATNTDVAVAAAVTAERERVQKIRANVRSAKLPEAFADDLIGRGVSVDDANAQIIAGWASQDMTPEPRPHNRVVITGDAVDRFRAGAEAALLARAGMSDGERNEFSGLTLRELARASLDVRNLSASGVTPMQMVQMAFNPVMAGGMHTTSDFVGILANVANKAMLKGYEEAGETFSQWTSTGVLTDFKPQVRTDMGVFDNLDEVPEGAEYTYGTFGDRSETTQLATYGKKFSISRQAIINDDMDAFTKVPGRMGRAAHRTVGNLVYAILTGNPKMSDGLALFHSSHGNLAGVAAAPSTAAFDAMRTAMATQKDKDQKIVALNIRPAYVIVPVALQGASTVVLASEFDTASGDKNVPNSVRDMATVIADARLDAKSSTTWYGAADPNAADTIEVSYLDGNDQPYLETREGWDVDGVEFKVRHDAGVKALGTKGLYKNVGA
jgi:ATP-dependent Clp endopeptidase proteolytic subunit ClpP